MKTRLLATFQFVVILTFAIYVVGCIAKKEVIGGERSKAKIGRYTLDYQYKGQESSVSFDVQFLLVEKSKTPTREPIVVLQNSLIPPSKIPFDEPAGRLEIADLVFSESDHAEQLDFRLQIVETILTLGFVKDRNWPQPGTILDDQVFFALDKCDARPEHWLNLQLSGILVPKSVASPDPVDPHPIQLTSFSHFVKFRSEEPRREGVLEVFVRDSSSLEELTGLPDAKVTILAPDGEEWSAKTDCRGIARFPIPKEYRKARLEIMVQHPDFVAEDRSRRPVVSMEGPPRDTILGEVGGTPNSSSFKRVTVTLSKKVQKDEDGDGIPDSQDLCPSVYGSIENKGCPNMSEEKEGERDSDQDGIPDDEDDCPNRPGRSANGGCPDDTAHTSTGLEDPDTNGNDGSTGGNTGSTVLPPPPPRGIEEGAIGADAELWSKISKSNYPADFEGFMKKYPDSEFVPMASERLKETQGEIVRGLLHYLIPDTMEVDLSSSASVVISADTTETVREAAVEELADYYDVPRSELPRIREEVIKITDVMRAQLVDPSPTTDRNFFISPEEAQEQKVDLEHKEPTVWNWSVTPLKKGRHPLIVRVFILFDENGKEVPRIEEQRFNVNVVVQPSAFQRNLPTFLGGGLGLLAILGLWWWRRRNQQKEQVQLELSYSEITDMVGQGELGSALLLLQQTLRGKSDRYYREVVQYQARLNRNEEQLRTGVIDNREANLEQNKIRFAVLKMLEKVKKAFDLAE